MSYFIFFPDDSLANQAIKLYLKHSVSFLFRCCSLVCLFIYLFCRYINWMWVSVTRHARDSSGEVTYDVLRLEVSDGNKRQGLWSDRINVFNTDPGVTILWCVCVCVWQFLLYCEGTRFTEKKHEISMQVAESKGLPKLKYHLLPRTKGFTTTLQCLKGTGQTNISAHSITVTELLCVILLRVKHCLLGG